MVVLKITFEQCNFKGVLIKAYNVIQRRMKLNTRTLFHRKIHTVSDDGTGLINYQK